MLPEHVHAIRRPYGKVDYYYQQHRGTPRQGQRHKLPPDPREPDFWKEYQRLTKGGERPSSGKTINDMVAAYLASPIFGQLAVNTKREYARHAALLRSLLGDDEAEDLRASHVAELRDTMGETPAKANAFVKFVAAIYAWGRERDFADHNPADRIRKLKIGEYKAWPQWAWETAMARFRPEIRNACLLGRYTSQRLGDVLRMTLRDIQTKEGVEGFHVVQQKTGKALHVPVLVELLPLLAETRARCHFQIVARTDGSAFTVDQFHAMWGREMKRDKELAKINAAGLSFHGLRKVFVVEGAHGGLTGSQIGAITGQTLPTVQRYAAQVEQIRLANSARKKLEGGNQ